MEPQRVNGSKRPARREVESAGHGRIIVARGNPARGKFEVAHFIVSNGQVKSLSHRDVFLASLTAAAQWVVRTYPSAKLTVGRKDRTGHLAALSFEVPVSELRARASRTR